ncbi:cation channel sperm-associated auxiliary subunit epsilon-like [Hemiscyllium ocellatum]|uniref:cation channel sperm-associated auxiliary subunit epsilon-like n=1 Tax=Hemiscyllium ocellatum TaxID=170820 RepID=UPI002966D050|nr:cation channel sperm-associated auxiliary subunit epsilon-like [Hemiscyllium ocellatum]
MAMEVLESHKAWAGVLIQPEPAHRDPGGHVLSSAAIWTSDNLYLLNSKTVTFAKHLKQYDWSDILRFPKNASKTIGAVSFGSRPPEIGVLIEVKDYFNQTKLFLTIYNEETNTWVLSTIFLYTDAESLPVSPLCMQFIESALPAVFIWSNKTVFYSLRNNSKNGKLQINGDEHLSNAVEGSTIHQIIFDHKLHIVIKMVNNLILFGTVGINTLVRLHVWERHNSNIILYSNLLSQIFVIKLVNSVIQEYEYPLETEIYSSLSMQSKPKCPFQQFKHNLEYPIYYLDMGESLLFWAEIIYKQESGLQIEIIDYNKNLLNWMTNYSYQITAHFYTRTKLVFYNRKRFGCPIRVYYKTPFKPILELYLGEKFISNVSANYILWEEEERTDFYYNTTMLQNYRSCFEAHGSVKSMDRPYEILNSTGSMYLTWPNDHNGIYLFTVKIVDPNFSFCELTAEFAIETYGVIISFAYSYYKYMKIFGEMLYYKQIKYT